MSEPDLEAYAVRRARYEVVTYRGDGKDWIAVEAAVKAAGMDVTSCTLGAYFEIVARRVVDDTGKAKT